MNIHLMKLLDAAVGRIAVSVLSSPPPIILPKSIASILIIRPGGIGDAVLLAPPIHALQQLFPALHITVLAEQRNAAVFPLIPGVDRLL